MQTRAECYSRMLHADVGRMLHADVSRMLHAGPFVGTALVAPVCAPGCGRGLRRCFALLSEGTARDAPLMGSLSAMEGVISKDCKHQYSICGSS